MVTLGDREDFVNKQSALPQRPPQNPWDTLIEDYEAWDIDVLGLTVTENNEDIAARMKLSANLPGLIVLRVAGSGPAGEHVSPGEIIQRINNQPVRTIDDLERIMTKTDMSRQLRIQVANNNRSSSLRNMSRIVTLVPNMGEESVVR